MTFFPVTLI